MLQRKQQENGQILGRTTLSQKKKTNIFLGASLPKVPIGVITTCPKPQAASIKLNVKLKTVELLNACKNPCRSSNIKAAKQNIQSSGKKQPFTNVLQNRCSSKFPYIHRETLLEFPFNFTLAVTPARVSSCEYYEIFTKGNKQERNLFSFRL